MKNTMIIVLGVILAAGGAFYAGMKYSQSQVAAAASARSQQFGGGTGPGFGGGRGARNGGGFVSGEILSKDNTSITLKLPDGGSKIVFLAASTSIVKSIEASPADLATGQTVMVNGSASQDGSVTAQSVQIRNRAVNTN